MHECPGATGRSYEGFAVGEVRPQISIDHTSILKMLVFMLLALQENLWVEIGPSWADRLLKAS